MTCWIPRSAAWICSLVRGKRQCGKPTATLTVITRFIRLISAGMMSSDRVHLLATVAGISNVAVTGSGTRSDPWEIAFVTASTDSSNNYRTMAQHYDAQAYVGNLIARDDTRGFGRFYRLT